MIICELKAGLGNQLFQYANARALSIKLNQELRFDLSFYEEEQNRDLFRLDKFNLKIKSAEKKDIQKLKRKILEPAFIRKIYIRIAHTPFINTKYHFDANRFQVVRPEKLLNIKDFYISGYFGDEKYFIEIEKTIRKEFTLKNELNIENKLFLSQIKDSNSVSIHIRRGDYVNNNYFAEIPLNYYRRSVDFIEKNFPGSTYFIFSDDLNWVKENLVLEQKTVFVDKNNASTDYMELMLMASCKHNIIANSTFSWWGAWLNNNQDKIVIAPEIWFGNPAIQEKYRKGSMVPNKWIKL